MKSTNLVQHVKIKGQTCIYDPTEQPIINVGYQYEDDDIGMILECRILWIFNGILQEKIHVLTAVDDIVADNFVNIQLQQRLIEEKNQHLAGYTKERIVLIPCNLGGVHWVGILLEFKADGSVERAEYIDSLGNSQGIPQNLQQQIQTVYPDCIVKTRTLLQQNDSTSCGAYTVENLLLSALNQPAIPQSNEKIRQLHLQSINKYKPGRYRTFYIRQKYNIKRTHSILEQLNALRDSNNKPFTQQQKKRITDIQYYLQNLTDKKVKNNLLLAFSPKEQDVDDIRSHLNVIRIALQQSIRYLNNNGNIQDQNALHVIIKVLFDVEWQIGLPLDVNIFDFKVGYNEILAIYQDDYNTRNETNDSQNNTSAHTQESEDMVEQSLEDEDFDTQLSETEMEMEFYDDTAELQQTEHHAIQAPEEQCAIQIQEDEQLTMQLQENEQLATQLQEDEQLATQLQEDEQLATQLQENEQLATKPQEDEQLATQLQEDEQLAMRLQYQPWSMADEPIGSSSLPLYRQRTSNTSLLKKCLRSIKIKGKKQKGVTYG